MSYTLYNTPETVDLIEAVNIMLNEYDTARLEAQERDKEYKRVIPSVELVKELISKFHTRDEKYVDIDH
jgi:hypothetical protein